MTRWYIMVCLQVGAGSMIEMMKFDMGGLGAVLGAARAVVALDTTPSPLDGTDCDLFNGIEVHFISAVCENMISRDAMRPGDIVTASNGKTIEIINTGTNKLQ
jgi:leucyl aminopeptidase